MKRKYTTVRKYCTPHDWLKTSLGFKGACPADISCFRKYQISMAKSMLCYHSNVILEIRVSQNLAKLGGGCTESRNFGGVSICV